MKKNSLKSKIIAFTVVGMITLGGTASEATLGDKALYSGVRHPDVKELQQSLRELDHFNHKTNTTYFGNITRNAVKEFQKANNLAVDGSFGPASYGALKGKPSSSNSSSNSSSASLSYKRALTYGKTGSDVNSLQKALKKLNHYNGGIDASFGPGTRSAVRSFQRAQKISVDGSAGPVTIRTMNNVLSGKTNAGKPSEEANRGSSVSSSNSVSSSKTMVMNASAYDLSYQSTGKRPGDRGYGITASGMKAGPGVVAVDPKVIPLGTKLYIESMDGTKDYGHAIAGDTGGAIKGKRIDLFFSSNSAARQFGRRNVRVKIVK